MFNFKEELSRYQPILEIDQIEGIPAYIRNAGSSGYPTAYCEGEKAAPHSGISKRRE